MKQEPQEAQNLPTEGSDTHKPSKPKKAHYGNCSAMDECRCDEIDEEVQP